jgi:hypothetical protein
MSNEVKGYLDIYRDGLFARALGRPWTSNPYPYGSDPAAFWFAGWSLIDESNDDTAPKDDYDEVDRKTP